jgi:hypothetical protein
MDAMGVDITSIKWYHKDLTYYIVWYWQVFKLKSEEMFVKTLIKFNLKLFSFFLSIIKI